MSLSQAYTSIKIIETLELVVIALAGPIIFEKADSFNLVYYNVKR